MTREETIDNLARDIALKRWYEDNPDPFDKHRLIRACQEAAQKGAQWADEHPESPWISVKDRLPDDGQKIVGHFTTAYSELDEVCHYPNNVIIDGSKGKLTRWFPFPEPIKER